VVRSDWARPSRNHLTVGNDAVVSTVLSTRPAELLALHLGHTLQTLVHNGLGHRVVAVHLETLRATRGVANSLGHADACLEVGREWIVEVRGE
jgi:hypothetical protein